jgi:hypothetical protein|tara:strand:- start:186 stop:509 length:324 start_codon:yes stop_codon:yes gene_type:complete
MAKQKFIYAQDGNNDALCWPVAQFLGFTHAADTTLLMKFQAQTNSDAATEIDQITLTIASNSEKAVMESIINAINDGYGPGMIVVADNVNQVYISSNVTDVACQTDS